MYQKYSERNSWKFAPVSSSEVSFNGPAIVVNPS